MNGLFAGLPPLDAIATDVQSLSVLFSLVAHTCPSSIIEAGTYQGHFAVGAARLLPETHIHTFDPTDFGWNKSLMPNVTFHQQDFDYIPEPCDFMFIDSGPPFEREFEHDVRLRHWRFARAHIMPGGIIACHDTNTTDWTGAFTIIKESDIRLRGGRGLTLWQAPT